MLLCPVRDCHLPLIRSERRVVCPRKHSFDIARSGYINLLQPQERRSRQPGDTVAAVAARRRLHERGVTQPLFLAIKRMVAASPRDIVLDAGCGDGFYLANLARETGCDAHGIDIAIPAIDAAARRYPQCEWIVANADRFVPYADRSFSLVLSITARMNSREFRRVLRDEGHLWLPSPHLKICSNCAAWAATARPAPSRHSLPISRSPRSIVSPLWPISTPPPSTTYCFQFIAPWERHPACLRTIRRIRTAMTARCA